MKHRKCGVEKSSGIIVENNMLVLSYSLRPSIMETLVTDGITKVKKFFGARLPHHIDIIFTGGDLRDDFLYAWKTLAKNANSVENKPIGWRTHI
jgi:hypothetical protein